MKTRYRLIEQTLKSCDLKNTYNYYRNYLPQYRFL
jgi:hypothetical protein